jgi:hypothetical protein
MTRLFPEPLVAFVVRLRFAREAIAGGRRSAAVVVFLTPRCKASPS